MSAALPPVTDCGCTSSSSSTPSGGSACCALTGVDDPNSAGILPTDATLWVEYFQLGDLINGPVIQVWYWNPNLLVWQ